MIIEQKTWFLLRILLILGSAANVDLLFIRIIFCKFRNFFPLMDYSLVFLAMAIVLANVTSGVNRPLLKTAMVTLLQLKKERSELVPGGAEELRFVRFLLFFLQVLLHSFFLLPDLFQVTTHLIQR